MSRPPSRYRTVRVCETCNQSFPFVAYPSSVALGRGRFCSKDCQKQWQTIPLEERFQRYIGSTNEKGCVLWTGTTNDDGYGIIGAGTQCGGNLLAHRVAWEIANGPIPDNMKILHRCDNPPCVFIGHLFLGTPGDNVRDMLAKGRQRKRVPGSRRYLQDERLGRLRK